MKITMITIGSQGDVQPYIALGAGLKAAGHRVRLATNPEFGPLVIKNGLEYCALRGNFRQVVASDAGQEAMHSGGNFLAFMGRYVKATGAMMDGLLADGWQACQGSEAIIYAAFSFFAYHIAEKLAVPSIAAYLYPVTPTGDFPSVGAPAVRLGRAYNRFSYALGQQLFWQPYRRRINRWRQEQLGLPPAPFLGVFSGLHRQRYPILYGFSPSFIRRPDDWGDWVGISGYWFQQPAATWTPSPALVDFLAAGPPPVYVGFGSMASRGAAAETALILRALRLAGRRGVLATGWGGLQPAGQGDDVFVLESAPHEWLFPQMAAVVHHGGAGTTAAGLRAGVPTIIIPFFGDQFFWGQHVAAMGLGPDPIPHKSLTAERLAAAIQQATGDPAMARRAGEMSAAIGREQGVVQAVQFVEASVSC
jgi:sterol 3beta-glucosyltransferase